MSTAFDRIAVRRSVRAADLLALEACSAQCLLAAEDGECACRCGGELHGALADADVTISADSRFSDRLASEVSHESDALIGLVLAAMPPKSRQLAILEFLGMTTREALSLMGVRREHRSRVIAGRPLNDDWANDGVST